jgi:hypothetical protein
MLISRFPLHSLVNARAAMNPLNTPAPFQEPIDEADGTSLDVVCHDEDDTTLPCDIHVQAPNQEMAQETQKAKLQRQAAFMGLTGAKQNVHLDQTKALTKNFEYFRMVGPIKFIVAKQQKVGVGVVIDGAFVFKKNWLFDVTTALNILNCAHQAAQAIEKLEPYEQMVHQVMLIQDQETKEIKELTAYYLKAEWHEKYGYNIHLRVAKDESGKERVWGRGVIFTVEEFKQFLHFLPHAAIAAKAYNMCDMQLARNTTSAIGKDILSFVKEATKPEDGSLKTFAEASVDVWFDQASTQEPDIKVTNLMSQMQEEDIDPIWKPLVLLFVLGHLVMEIARPMLLQAMRHESTLKTLGRYREEDAKIIVGRSIVIIAEKEEEAPMDQEAPTDNEATKVSC